MVVAKMTKCYRLQTGNKTSICNVPGRGNPAIERTLTLGMGDRERLRGSVVARQTVYAI